MAKPTVFISYSHRDEAWKDRLVAHLGVLVQLDEIAVWDDRRIETGYHRRDRDLAAFDEQLKG